MGITLQLYDHGAVLEKTGACCAGQDIYDARQVAEKLGIPHYILNYESNFKESVIDDFADSYLRGETPLPCVRCNQRVKFQDLLKTARDLDAEFLATGHYVQRLETENGAELHRGLDPKKDQSYFLFATTPEQLDFLRFPLGGMTKDETRKLAEKYGLSVADKPDSQDICFVPNGKYGELVKKLRPEAQAPGQIVHIDGTVLGEHEGIVSYTIGQRRGLGLGGGETGGTPLYVVALDPDTKRVYAGPREALAKNRVHLKESNWIGPSIPEDGLACHVKLRSVGGASPARVYRGTEDNTLIVDLDAPQYGVAAGQAAVCYTDSRLLGGGWIVAAENTRMPVPLRTAVS